jgi:serine/threonine protein kinase/Flp pilus assembly protein TadD
MSDAKTDAKAIFLEALECKSADELRSFLDQACGTDPALRARVEELLRAHQDAGAFLGGAEARDATRDQPGAERPGTIIGPYKLLEQIGEGGFGLVFMAEQQHPVRRKVALKVLKPGMDTRQVIARFEAERQALALMDHPNIARVLDAGETSSGRPHFVMELVKGVPITDYCDQNRLTTRDRLALFTHVCHAVQHAHHKGIIHRDLKPSNVMVTLHDGVPVVKVIDFGIAKALGQQLTDKTLFTGFAQMVGTPMYMSPEQAQLSGLDIDTRSDIYSLGVLLYELLAGVTPFDGERMRTVGYDEMRRIIREEDPPSPSTRLSTLGQTAVTVSAERQSDPKRLCRLLRGELDWIVMKALEKDRNRRYETANELARDIERYLKDEPVQACPPSAWYRCRKFVRRRKTLLATTGLILFFIVLLLIGVGWVVRDRAARETALLGEANRAVSEARSLIADGKWPEALAVIERTEAVLVTAGRQDALVPPGLRELDKDLAMARRLEEIHSQPGRQELVREKQAGGSGAWRLAESDSRTMTEEIFGGQELAAAYARAFQGYGIDMAVLPVEEAAERIRGRSIRLELARALDFWSSMRRRRGNTGPPDWKRLLAVAKLADPDPWRNGLRDALQCRDRKALEALEASAEVASLSPATLHLLGYALNDVGAADHAVSLLRRAQLQYPGDLWLNDALGWLCYSTPQPPQYDESVRFYTAARAIRPRNPYMAYSIGRALRDKGSFAEAITEFTKAIELKPDHRDAFWGRAYCYSELGQPKSALADCSKVIELHPKLAVAWSSRSVAYTNLGQYDKALADCSKAIELDPKFALGWRNRGTVYANLRQYDKVIADSSKAIELDPKLAVAWNDRSWAYANLGQYDKALADSSKAVELDPRRAVSWRDRSLVYVHLGQYDKALADSSKAVELDPRRAVSWHDRSLVYVHLGQSGKAIADYTKASELDPKNANLHNDVAWALATDPNPNGRDPGRAVSCAKKAVELAPNDGNLWNTLGVAHYRAGDWKAALAALEKSMNLGKGGDCVDWFFSAMSHEKLGEKEKARQWYDRAIRWTAKTNSSDEEISRFRTEAAELLGVSGRTK